ncbi:MAG: hypothetical protein ACI81L_002968 [Verrucomicrobiales bacterium]
MWLPWEYGLVLAVVFATGAWTMDATRPSLAAFAREATIISLLYSLWQFAGRLSLLGIDDALARGAWLWDLERTLLLPNELTLQTWMIPSSFWTQFSNLYYAIAHVPVMGIFLVWLFARHRERYSSWRNALALVTGVCLLIQLIPVAPPRLTDETGMIDTGLAYGQSVYGVLGRGVAGQLQAMPSIHVAWAALIGWAAWSASTSRWRWLGPIHFAITFVVVALTGNHYWLDGLVAMFLLVFARATGVRIAAWTSIRRPVAVPLERDRVPAR